MIKKGFKYLLGFFVLGLGLLNFSFGAYDKIFTCNVGTECTFQTDTYILDILLDEHGNFLTKVGNTIYSGFLYLPSTSYVSGYGRAPNQAFVVGWKDGELYLGVYASSSRFQGNPKYYGVGNNIKNLGLGEMSFDVFKSYFEDYNIVSFSIGYASICGNPVYCSSNRDFKYCFEFDDDDSTYLCFYAGTLDGGAGKLKNSKNYSFALNSPENIQFYDEISPFNPSSSGGGGQRFPINNRRPVINGNTIGGQVLVEDTLEYYETVYKYNPNICFAGRDLGIGLQIYIPGSGANIFEVANYVAPIDSNYLRDYGESIYKSAVSSFYTSRFNKYESLNFVSTYNPFDSEIPALYNVVSNLYPYYNIRSGVFSTSFIDYCYLYLNYNTGDLYTGLYLSDVSQYLDLKSQGIAVDYTGSYYVVGLGYDFSGDSILGSLSGENQNLNLSDFFSSVSDSLTSIFNVGSYSNNGVIPQYILWFLVLFLLFKVLRK